MDADTARAVRAKLESDFQTAWAYLQQQAAAGDQDPETRFLLGWGHYRLKQYREAAREFHNTIATDPTRADAYYYLGLIAEKEGDTTRAIRFFETAVRLNPEMQQARTKLAKLRPPTAGPTMSGMAPEPAPWSPVPASVPPPPTRQTRRETTELSLPTTDEERDVYREAKRWKAREDQRAANDAFWTGMPWWLVGLVILVVLGMAAIIYSGVTGQDQHQDEFCQYARDNQLPTPPGCEAET